MSSLVLTKATPLEAFSMFLQETYAIEGNAFTVDIPVFFLW